MGDTSDDILLLGLQSPITVEDDVHGGTRELDMDRNGEIDVIITFYQELSEKEFRSPILMKMLTQK